MLGFEQRADAERFLGELRERLGKFGLELHPAKTRMIEFGRWAIADRCQRGAGKPETFDFLGFTHMCEINRKSGYFMVRRKTARKRMRATLQEIKRQLRMRMHAPLRETGEWLRSVVGGYNRYHGAPGNVRTLNGFWPGGGAAMAANAASAEPQAADELATLLRAGGSICAACSCLPSVSGAAVCGHASEVRAV